MAIKVCLVITGVVMLLALAAGGNANGDTPSKCEVACAATAKIKIAQCNNVVPCVDYEESEYRSCIRACDAKGSK